MGVSHTTSEHINKQSAPVTTSCITLMGTRMYQLLKDLLSIFSCKWRACYPAYVFPLLLGDGMPTRGPFQKMEHVFWQVFCFSKCSPFVSFSSCDIWWISQKEEEKNWTKPTT
jgi:hypothetical protein